MNYKNFSCDLREQLAVIAAKNAKREIIPGTDHIAVTGKVVNEDDLLLGADSMLDGWLTAGRFATEFESEFTKYFGASKALLVNSGSSANLVAFYTLTS
ncbi:DegT/DnrJ/EryC1/StrS family aminotransferase, partial [Pseudomonas viridiflava]|uniref:DegT/DnrJ/EryC1/StrS family aminotransferase n=1 Tax=Pseudomonas viridiflava TaxID=33069 RepID=UPI00197E1C52